MKILSKKNILVAVITLMIGVAAAFGAIGLFNRSTTVEGTVAAFILNPEGKPDGVVLDTGDQIHFGAETGLLVAQQIKIGDRLSVTGKIGSSSNYGRELRAESLQIGDQTITVLKSAPKPPRDGERGPKPRPAGKKMPPPPVEDANAPKPDDAKMPKPEDAPIPPVAPKPLEKVSANGQVRFVLVGGRGEARGLILSSGEQIELPKEVNDANLSFNQDTQVSVEGETASSEFGKFIHPTRLTIGNQTFSFNR